MRSMTSRKDTASMGATKRSISTQSRPMGALAPLVAGHIENPPPSLLERKQHRRGHQDGKRQPPPCA